MTAHEPSLRTYLIVFAVLMALLAVTVAVAFIPLGPLNVAIVLLIASSKAVLIALYFMHVRYSARLTWATAGGTFVWLAILFSLTMSDYATRGMFSDVRESRVAGSESARD